MIEDFWDDKEYKKKLIKYFIDKLNTWNTAYKEAVAIVKKIETVDPKLFDNELIKKLESSLNNYVLKEARDEEGVTVIEKVKDLILRLKK